MGSFSEPTCAICQVGSYASLSVCYLTKSHWTIIHISISMVARVTKFDVDMHLDAIFVDLEGQGHKPEVKVTMQAKKCYFTLT